LGPWFYFILFSFCSGTWLIAAETSADYLFSIDSLTYDNLGNSVRLTGFAWFVFGTQN
jgi:hypothetical protein